MSGPRIELDPGACEGIGMCESLLPSHFRVGDDGLVAVLHTDSAGADAAELRAAVDACPARALRLTGG